MLAMQIARYAAKNELFPDILMMAIATVFATNVDLHELRHISIPIIAMPYVISAENIEFPMNIPFTRLLTPNVWFVDLNEDLCALTMPKTLATKDVPFAIIHETMLINMQMHALTHVNSVVKLEFHRMITLTHVIAHATIAQ
jgi:hypothetical protein